MIWHEKREGDHCGKCLVWQYILKCKAVLPITMLCTVHVQYLVFTIYITCTVDYSQFVISLYVVVNISSNSWSSWSSVIFTRQLIRVVVGMKCLVICSLSSLMGGEQYSIQLNKHVEHTTISIVHTYMYITVQCYVTVLQKSSTAFCCTLHGPRRHSLATTVDVHTLTSMQDNRVV